MQQAVLLMGQLGLEAGKSPVYFGQLLGMADHLTFTLGSNGYPAFKYVPYGLVHEVRAGRERYLPFGCLQHCSTPYVCGCCMMPLFWVQVVPYLLRRAQENASIMTGAKADAALLEAELRRRAKARWPWLGGSKQSQLAGDRVDR